MTFWKIGVSILFVLFVVLIVLAIPRFRRSRDERERRLERGVTFDKPQQEATNLPPSEKNQVNERPER